MTVSSRPRVAAAVAAGLVAVSVVAASPALANNASDRTIVPGVRAGAVTSRSTPAALRRIYGRNIVMKRLHEGEGMFADGAVLFPGTRSELHLFFRDGKKGVRRIVVPQRSTVWRVRTRGGQLRIGASMLRVVQVNGRHFKLERENDGHNCAGEWRGGRLSKQVVVCFRETRKLGDRQGNRISRYKGLHSRLRIVGRTFVVKSFTIYLRQTASRADASPSKAAAGATGRLTAAQTLCKRLLSVSSRRGGLRTAVTFVNRSGAHRSILWLNYRGRPVDRASLNNGQRYAARTRVGHLWMVADGPGNCLEIHRPVRGRLTVVLRPDRRTFGPE